MTIPKLPAHANPASRQRISQAPYNFVPLPEQALTVKEKCLPKHDRFDQNRLTGWLDLAITTETPLYIRCAVAPERVKDNEDEDNPRNNPARQHFFHHGEQDNPVIPGSSLRGMTRSLVEILGYAKLQWFARQRLVYRAVGDISSLGIGYRKRLLGPPKPGGGLSFDYPSHDMRGGYLKQDADGYYIQPAQTVHGETFVHVEYGLAGAGPRLEREDYGAQDIVQVFLRPPAGRTLGPPAKSTAVRRIAFLHAAWVTREEDVVRRDQVRTPPDAFSPAVIVRSGHMTGTVSKRFHCAIYGPNEHAAPLRVSDEMWKLYRDDRDISRGIPCRKLGARLDKKPDGDPLFYLVDTDGKLVFFGPTMMFRLPYEHSREEFVPERLQATDDGEIDLAEAVFGTVDRKPAVKGRVFFHDAPWDKQGGNPFLKEGDGTIVPQILSTPKPTSFQHYLGQPNIQPEQRGSAPVPAADTDRGHGLLTWDHPYQGDKTYPLYEQDAIRWHANGSVLRGHKLYWHKPGTQESDIRATQEESRRFPKQHTIVRPVRRGVTFGGRVSFENLSLPELGALLAALQLPSNMRHHLGMGKPMGMGSVRIQATLHLTDRVRRYVRLLDDDGHPDLGELTADQVAAKESNAKEAFRSAVITHVKATEEPGISAGADLWSVSRLKALAALLEWEKPPSRALTDYVPTLYRGPGNRGIQWWRERRVLPTPEGVIRGPAPDFAGPGPAGQRRGGVPGPTQAGARPAPQRPPSPRPATPGGARDYPGRPVLFSGSRGADSVQPRTDTPSTQKPAESGSTGQQREVVTLTTDVRDGKARVRVQRAEVDCTGFGGGNLLKTGDRCIAVINYRNGIPLSATFKGRTR